MERDSYDQAVAQLAQRTKDLAALAGKNPHVVLDHVRGEVTLPTKGQFAGNAFSLEIGLGNAAMRTGQDIAYALRTTAEKLDGGATEGTIRDLNGNTVGRFTATFLPDEEGGD